MMLMLFYHLGRATVSPLLERVTQTAFYTDILLEKWPKFIPKEIKDKIIEARRFSTMPLPEYRRVRLTELAIMIDKEIELKVKRRANELEMAYLIGLFPWDIELVKELHEAIRLRGIKIPEEIERLYRYAIKQKSISAIISYMKALNAHYEKWLKTIDSSSPIVEKPKIVEKGEELLTGMANALKVSEWDKLKFYHKKFGEFIEKIKEVVRP